MSFYTGYVTLSGTGSQSYTGIGFQPSFIIFTVGQKTGSDNNAHFSQGRADGTRQSVTSIYWDATGGKTVNTSSNSKCVSHYERVGGTITEVLNASLTSFDADGYTLNQTTGSANYQVNVMCFA